MENFVLYDDIGRGNQCVVYKGRRKGSINFVAINCIEKSKRHLITNAVRLIHEISHDNIAKFYEWYETSNHLWMIVELCTGGSLRTVIEQDSHLPESCIRTFGSDLVNGLHHIHSLGIIYCDLKPSNILLDGPGHLKFADFGLSRMEGEDINELFEQFSEAGEQWSAGGSYPNKVEGTNLSPDMKNVLKNNGTPVYMAPELLQGSEPSMASDLWSLGCVLYEMFTGNPPFLAGGFQDLTERILNQDFPMLKARGSRTATKPSVEFVSLLTSLLMKNPDDRLDWSHLVVHPFWQNCLKHLVHDVENTLNHDLRESLRRSIASFTQTLGKDSFPQGADQIGNIMDSTQSNTFESSPEPSSNLRPRSSAHGNTDVQVQFTLSSRPHTAMVSEDSSMDKHLTKPVQSKTLLQVEAGISNLKLQSHIYSQDYPDESTLLIYHSTDFAVLPITEDNKKPGLMKFDPKMLSFPTYPVEKLLSMTRGDLEKHCIALVESLSSSERGSAKFIQLLGYCAAVGCIGSLADVLIQHNVLTVLAQHIKEAQQIEIKCRICLVLIVCTRCVVSVNESANISEALSVMTDLLRDGFRNSKLKAAILPAVGELLYLVASQENRPGGMSIKHWVVPPLLYSLIIRCLRDGEEVFVNQIAVKIIENIASKSGAHTMKFATVDVGSLLWYICTHNSLDQTRISAYLALCMLSRNNPCVFQNVLEKVGQPKVLVSMSIPVVKIQQAMITMFVGLVASGSCACLFLQDKEYLLHVIRLLESPNNVIRAKAFLALQQIILSSHEMLLHACANRLVMYIERDSRKQVPSDSDNASSLEYLSKCLEQLLNSIADTVPAISKEIVSVLDLVAGRKHPTTIQVKQIKACLPLTPVLRHCVTSAVLRPKIVSKSFMLNLAKFTDHILQLDSKSAQILETEEFTHTVFTIIESIVQHPAIIAEYCTLAVDQFLPTFASLIFSPSGDTSALSLRIFSEISFVIFNNEICEASQHQAQIKKLYKIVAETLLPRYEEILLLQDPLPSYGLKLLLFLLEHHHTLIRDVEKVGLVPVLFQVLEDHKMNPMSSVVKHIVGILNCFVGRKEVNVKELYEQGLVRHVSYLFLETSQTCLTAGNGTSDLKATTTVLAMLLDTINGALRYVSEIVRRALEARKGGNGTGTNVTRETEEAEDLLLVNKPLAQLVCPLTQLLVYEDVDVAELSLKCLSLLVQLYGADTTNSLSPINMECYTLALKNADAKKQKVILRILKRMITMDRHHTDVIKQHGAALTEVINALVQTASSNADVAMSTLALEILKIIG